MISFKQDTLAYQLGVRPGTRRIDISRGRVVEVAKAISVLLDNKEDHLPLHASHPTEKHPKKAIPESEALSFYLMNHAVCLVKQSRHPLAPLGDMLPVVTRFHNVVSAQAVRMFSYLMLICTRESRHVSGVSWKKPIPEVSDNELLKFVKFNDSIQHSGSGEAVDKFKKTPPDMSLGEYVLMLKILFYKGAFSSGFGGAKWGNVASLLVEFVFGRISAEVMIDTAYTLSHNNGPIFNKGMLFTGYSKELITILDVQRAGQIPQYVKEYPNFAEKGTLYTAKANLSLLEGILPSDQIGCVDWPAVVAAGAVGPYAKSKAAEHQTAPKATASSMPIGHKVGLEIMPGVTVPFAEVLR